MTGKRTIAGETGSSGRSGNRGSGTEMPPAAAAESRPATTHPAEVPAAEMATTSEMAATAEVPATAVTTAAVAATAMAATVSTAASGIGRARQRDRKNNHGQDFEF